MYNKMAGMRFRTAVLSSHIAYRFPFTGYQISCRFLKTKNLEDSSLASRLGSRMWKIVKGVFLMTGGLVWLTAITKFYRRRNVVDKAVDGMSSVNQFFGLTETGLKDRHNIEDFLQKKTALSDLWERLRKEESIEKEFGSPCEICGFRLHSWKSNNPASPDVRNGWSSDDLTDTVADETTTKWERSFIVEGPKLVGQLDTTFELVNNTWVPTMVKLGGLSPDGNTLVDVSAPPPNGVSRFTRLSVLR